MRGRNSNFSLDNSVLLFSLGLVWLVAGVLGSTKYLNGSIMVFLIGTTLIKPFTKAMRRCLGIRIKSTEFSLNFLTCLTIAKPLGILLVFFFFIKDINVFYPAFGLLTALIFVSAAFVLESKIYFLIAGFLFFSAIYSWLYAPNSFAFDAFINGSILLVFALISRVYPIVLKYLSKYAFQRVTVH